MTINRPKYFYKIKSINIMSYLNRSVYGVNKAIIVSSEFNLSKEPFHRLRKESEAWKLSNNFLNPGPPQLYGPLENSLNCTIRISYHNYMECVKKIEELTEKIRGTCRFFKNWKSLLIICKIWDPSKFVECSSHQFGKLT